MTKGSDLGLESLFADLYLPKKGSEELEQLVAEGTSSVIAYVAVTFRFMRILLTIIGSLPLTYWFNSAAEGTGIVRRAVNARRRARGEGGPKYAPPSLAGEARYRVPSARGASGGGEQGEDAEEEPDWAASLAGRREDPNPFLPQSGGSGGSGGGSGGNGKLRQIALPDSLR